MLAIAKICPTQSRHLEHCLFPTVIPGCGPFNRSIRNLIRREIAGSSQRESDLQKGMSLVPIDVVGNFNLVGSRIQRDVLNKSRLLPAPDDTNRAAQWTIFDQFN